MWSVKGRPAGAGAGAGTPPSLQPSAAAQSEAAPTKATSPPQSTPSTPTATSSAQQAAGLSPVGAPARAHLDACARALRLPQRQVARLPELRDVLLRLEDPSLIPPRITLLRGMLGGAEREVVLEAVANHPNLLLLPEPQLQARAVAITQLFYGPAAPAHAAARVVARAPGVLAVPTPPHIIMLALARTLGQEVGLEGVHRLLRGCPQLLALKGSGTWEPRARAFNPEADLRAAVSALAGALGCDSGRVVREVVMAEPEVLLQVGCMCVCV